MGKGVSIGSQMKCLKGSRSPQRVMSYMTMVSLDTLSHPITPFPHPPVATAAIAHSQSAPKPNRFTIAVAPEEIIVKILEWCDFKGVLACQLTCRAFRNVVVGSTSLRYKLALSEHGMCDGLSNNLSAAEKLELLTAHADAWRSLESACPKPVDILVGWSAPIAISCNVMVFSRDSRQSENNSGRRDDDAEVAPDPHLDLLVLRVPSALRRVKAAHWVLALPVDVCEVCIDASRDLLIYLLDSTFYTCTLSTGAVHPLTEHEGSFGLWNGSRRFDVFNLCVCGDYIAAGTRVYFISVWNWKTGQLVSDQISEVNFSSFDFLDEHHILYAVSKEDSIYVYDLRRDQEQQLKQRQKEKETRLLRFQLALPPINRATTSRYIQLRRNALPPTENLHRPPPFMDGRISIGNGDSAPVPIIAPFHADPHERLIVARVVTSPVERGEEQFELHVPARAFLDHFSVAATGQNRQRDDDENKVEEDGAVVVPWSQWSTAVRATPPRKLPYAIQARMVVYGMRAVAHPPDWDEGVLHVDSYLTRRREEAESDTTVGAGAGAEARAGTRQAIRLPREVEDKADFLSVLCEDALLCYKLDPLSSKISHAYWYTF